MIERERKKKIQARQAEEEKAMADIRRKMERIKEQRIQKHRQKYDNHYQGMFPQPVGACGPFRPFPIAAKAYFPA